MPSLKISVLSFPIGESKYIVYLSQDKLYLLPEKFVSYIVTCIKRFANWCLYTFLLMLGNQRLHQTSICSLHRIINIAECFGKFIFILYRFLNDQVILNSFYGHGTCNFLGTNIIITKTW